MTDRNYSLRTLDRDVHARRNVARSGLHPNGAVERRQESKSFDNGNPIALSYDAAYFRFTTGAPLLAPPPAPAPPARVISQSASVAPPARRAFSFDELEQEQEQAEEVSREQFEALVGESESEELAPEEENAPAPDRQAFAQRMLERAQQQELERAVAASNDEEDGNPAPSPGSHRIFDDLARHMSQATTYDVGKVDVNSLFREFDERLDRKSKKTKTNANVPARAFSRDGDLAEDLDLIALAASSAAIADSPPPVVERSGPRWVDRYPDSRELASLESPFRANVERLTNALADAGARMRVGSTRIPAERAYLMHWSWRIANGHDAQSVPTMNGVAIDWWHGDPTTSKAAALLMASGFGVENASAAPPLESKHTRGQAADIDVAWDGELTIRAADGTSRTIAGTPRSENNSELIELARTYEVVRGSDAAHAAHWSTDGT